VALKNGTAMGMRVWERWGWIVHSVCEWALEQLDMGLDYDSTVMLTCKLLFAAAKAIVDIGPHMPRQS